jgi:uncharacterized protein (DUF362 family)
MGGHRVLIRRCESYDPERIAVIVSEGMTELGFAPAGRILLKPNCVLAHPTYVPDACTRAEFLDGVLAACRIRGRGVERLTVGEKSGLAVPTRWSAANAGYPEVCARHGARMCYFEETRQVPVQLTAEGRLRDMVYLPRPVVDADCLINLPKLKAHPWTKMTASLKNYIGLQDDRHRVLDHDGHLERKIADLQEVVQSRFIAVDAVIAGELMMICAEPRPLGAVIMGTNSCAVDTVCAHILHLDPAEVVHLRLSSERGYGPCALDDIEIGGDYPPEEVRARSAGFRILHRRIDEHFRDGPVTCTVGAFPEEEWRDYCWGGCPGVLQEVVHLCRRVFPGCEDHMKKVRCVVGRVAGPLDLAPDERVLFLGDCTSWEGAIDGEPVAIESRHTSHRDLGHHGHQSVDPLRGMLRFRRAARRAQGVRWHRLGGCPVSQAELHHYLALLGGIPDVGGHSALLRGRSSHVYTDYLKMRTMRLLRHVVG